MDDQSRSDSDGWGSDVCFLVLVFHHGATMVNKRFVCGRDFIRLLLIRLPLPVSRRSVWREEVPITGDKVAYRILSYRFFGWVFSPSREGVWQVLAFGRRAGERRCLGESLQLSSGIMDEVSRIPSFELDGTLAYHRSLFSRF